MPLADSQSALELPAEDVVAGLETVCAKPGDPKTIRVYRGSELASHDLDLRAYAKDATLNFSRPGKPTDNGFIEAFNGRFRSECPNIHWPLTLADAADRRSAKRIDGDLHEIL